MAPKSTNPSAPHKAHKAPRKRRQSMWERAVLSCKSSKSSATYFMDVFVFVCGYVALFIHRRSQGRR
eukprot:m.18544 g.18544  ORF g.18544 m.18544 type:complete len:67 (-) comp7902_c0_seq2:123-323(-)